ARTGRAVGCRREEHDLQAGGMPPSPQNGRQARPSQGPVPAAPEAAETGTARQGSLPFGPTNDPGDRPRPFLRLAQDGPAVT
ncbi:hypothetical protein VQ045_05050, partial [Aurantimonas sp. E1-2-R+4]|uniref:hypothetical protein n=1 Tax=Aurantimonas sp. E1-2-R+4 TaxID=3113714 RepID=UPI002F923158